MRRKKNLSKAETMKALNSIAEWLYSFWKAGYKEGYREGNLDGLNNFTKKEMKE